MNNDCASHSKLIRYWHMYRMIFRAEILCRQWKYIGTTLYWCTQLFPFHFFMIDDDIREILTLYGHGQSCWSCLRWTHGSCSPSTSSCLLADTGWAASGLSKNIQIKQATINLHTQHDYLSRLLEQFIKLQKEREHEIMKFYEFYEWSDAVH